MRNSVRHPKTWIKKYAKNLKTNGAYNSQK
jgi:hypothetical protein